MSVFAWLFSFEYYIHYTSVQETLGWLVQNYWHLLVPIMCHQSCGFGWGCHCSVWALAVAEYAPHLWCHACIALSMCYIYIRLLFGIACLAYHTAIKFALYQPLYPEFIVNYCFDIKRAAATFALFACTLNGKHKWRFMAHHKLIYVSWRVHG